jgi:uncharacterized membrane protein YeaQ/YmgE (transglycosylase-associated protein family)
MSILLWLLIGFLAGVSAKSFAGAHKARFVLDLAIGLAASLAAGIAFLTLA